MKPIIEVKNLTKYYGANLALSSIDLTFLQHRIHCVVGPNGAGKTTLFKLLLGLTAPSEGEVVYYGGELKREVAVLFDHLTLYESMTVDEYLNFMRTVKGVENQENPLVEKILSPLPRHSYCKELSRGQKQRVSIAATLLSDEVKLLILDEPLTALDPLSLMEVRDLIKDLGQRASIILSAHQLREVEDICQDVTILNKGSVLFNGTMEEVLREGLNCLEVEVAYLGEESSLDNLLSRKEKEEKRESKKKGLITYTKLRLQYEKSESEKGQAALLKKLVEGGLQVVSFRPVENDLEQVFKRLMGSGS